MSIARDFRFSRDGDVLSFFGTRSASGNLPPNQGIEIKFRAHEGPMKITVVDLQFDNGAEGQLIGAHVDPAADTGEPGDVVITYNHVPLRVELFAPDNDTPVASWTTDTDPAMVFSEFHHVVGGANSPAGNWNVRVRNNFGTDQTATCAVGVDHVIDVVEARTRDIPLRLLNNAFSIALEAISPSAHISGNTATFSFGEELRDFLGDDAPEVLGSHSFELPSSIEGSGETQQLTFRAKTGQDLLAYVDEVHARRKAVLEAQMDVTPRFSLAGQFLQSQLEANENWREEWQDKVEPQFPVLHANLVVSKIEAELDLLPPLPDIDIAELEPFSVDLFCAYVPSLFNCAVLAHSDAKFSGGVADKAEDLGIIPEAGNLIAEVVPDFIEPLSHELGRYLGELLVQLVRRGNVFLNVQAVGDRWRVEHCLEPSTGPHDVVGVGTVSAIGVGATDPSGPAPDQPENSDDDNWLDGSEQSKARLDEIQTIVVLMMENRSFDHMLGYLTQSGGTRYDGLRLDGSQLNPPPPPFTQDFLPQPASDIVRPIVTKIPVDPNHGLDSVKRQIAGGEMTGFVADLATKTTRPEYAMAYYTDDDLPVYYQLAQEYAVCQKWFCSHPGSTWPNRWATVMGSLVETKNLSASDPRIGYLEGSTLFDMLNLYEISWKYFEGDLAFLRLFDRFRLDDDHIIPYGDETDGFEATFNGDTPPPSVIFIDPNFISIPPRSTANDDHPTADLAAGQQLVRHIFNVMSQSPHWQNTMLVITYDEHGGFYDHVAPPGLPNGPDGHREPVDRIHPEGETFMGVRVPTLVVSPRVGQGVVSDVVFDHTSILKTILVRHRERIQAHHLRRFGARVNKANHLGEVLDGSNRSDVPDVIERVLTRSVGPPATPSTAAANRLEPGRPMPVRATPAVARVALPLVAPTSAETLLNLVAEKGAKLRKLSRSLKRLESALADELIAVGEVATNAGNDPMPTSGGGDDEPDFHLSLRRAFVPRKL